LGKFFYGEGVCNLEIFVMDLVSLSDDSDNSETDNQSPQSWLHPLQKQPEKSEKLKKATSKHKKLSYKSYMRSLTSPVKPSASPKQFDSIQKPSNFPENYDYSRPAEPSIPLKVQIQQILSQLKKAKVRLKLMFRTRKQN
jgi:hypothetical protein